MTVVEVVIRNQRNRRERDFCVARVTIALNVGAALN